MTLKELLTLDDLACSTLIYIKYIVKQIVTLYIAKRIPFLKTFGQSLAKEKLHKTPFH
jgi:hypothetical protein